MTLRLEPLATGMATGLRVLVRVRKTPPTPFETTGGTKFDSACMSLHGRGPSELSFTTLRNAL